ncbi:MAG: helix-hairpin-helix domain-containing protein [Rhodoferax sp.]|nr:helix-hairpin-helix domain-containing protein [Rhodoferax sp.]
MPQAFTLAALPIVRRWLCGMALLACGATHALELNAATEAQLDGLRGLGPSTTARILLAREAGPFLSWADFMARVKGIKPATAAKFAAQGLTVRGEPFKAESP